VFHLVFHEPQIPLNTGSAIRTCAATGTHLHLVEPLGFELSDAKLRRAGLDYHDLASVTVHPSLAAVWSAVSPRRVIAFTTQAGTAHSDVSYEPGDALLFGTEATGLPPEVLDDPAITTQVRIPMLAARRSLNLSNSAAIAIYEAWRQCDYAGT
jgi:tRNA (cytidine/uridine-2'-O-)-methyltransferase